MLKDVTGEGTTNVTSAPMERWRIVAYPLSRTPPAVPDGALRLTRRRFAYDIWPEDEGASRR
jgi:hypothetical protein